jgi:uncharacterized coiled-coil DUF342 family protein
MANVINYLEQIQKLTNTNLEILKTLNDSFFTKKSHLIAQVNDTSYVIPSFLSLENKINMLQENFENLVHAPETSEAYFNFDGNTRAIEVRKYSHVPDSISLFEVNNYNVEQNDIFKDFLTPVPYINLDLPKLPNDIYEVNVKKIVPKSEALKSIFNTKLTYVDTFVNENGETVSQTKTKTSINCAYSDVNKMLLNYVENTDYIEYDTVYKLPIREHIGAGTYVIEKVISDVIDEDLNEFITLKLRNDLSDPLYSNKLTYRQFNESIEKPIKVGDELINYNGTGKVVVTELRPSTNTIVVRVVNGEYLNFIGTESYDTDKDSDIHDLSKLRYHSSVDFAKDKYIKVPLEEDQYVFVAVAPINSRMNTQASWGNGLIIDSYSLMDSNEKESFKAYYDNFVKNIGDVLFEMTSMVTSPITELTESDFNYINSLKPTIDTNILSVMQINKHLNNSTTVQSIRTAYSQKKNANTRLAEVQNRIDDINKQLANISFDDVNGMRNIYNAQLNALTAEKNALVTTITKAIESISLNVNSSEIPIENAKYRIRGFYVPSNLGTVNNEDLSKHVIGVRVQYRYKNLSAETGTATSISNPNGETYIFSDWNNMSSFDKVKTANYNDGTYLYKYEDSNESKNEPSYNQIDIPISQGESVDIRIKLLYDFGQPYINVTSNWSDIVNIEFPDEFAKDVPILTIIEENNNDIETNRFDNILKTTGVDDHVKDMIMDQDITYYHKPDNIASGFYTAERRIIPLKDKLQTLSNEIDELKNELLGVQGNLNVSVSVGDDIVQLYSDQDNSLILEPYNSFDTESSTSKNGSYTFDKNKVVSTFVNIVISNTSNNAIKLYSVFPGSRSVALNEISNSDKINYCDTYGGVYFKSKTDVNEKIKNIQTQNQFITFRINDAWDRSSYYTSNGNPTTDNVQSSKGIDDIASTDINKAAMVIYPYVSDSSALCINSDAVRSYMMIHPGEEIIVPMLCQYRVTNISDSIRKTISFDLRTSLYADPTNYCFTVIGKNNSSIEDRAQMANKKKLLQRLFNPIKYNTTVR